MILNRKFVLDLAQFAEDLRYMMRQVEELERVNADWFDTFRRIASMLDGGPADRASVDVHDVTQRIRALLASQEPAEVVENGATDG